MTCLLSYWFSWGESCVVEVWSFGRECGRVFLFFGLVSPMEAGGAVSLFSWAVTRRGAVAVGGSAGRKSRYYGFFSRSPLPSLDKNRVDGGSRWKLGKGCRDFRLAIGRWRLKVLQNRIQRVRPFTTFPNCFERKFENGWWWIVEPFSGRVERAEGSFTGHESSLPFLGSILSPPWASVANSVGRRWSSVETRSISTQYSIRKGQKETLRSHGDAAHEGETRGMVTLGHTQKHPTQGDQK